jgi:protein-tyrosine phosphatase
MLSDQGLSEKFKVDSAGTSAYHEGNPADGRMQKHAKLRGYDLPSLSRPFCPESDFQDFDYIITMDDSNYKNVVSTTKDPELHKKVYPMTSFCKIHDIDHVPDPYYRGDEGFEHVMDILEDACTELLKKIST